MKMMDVIFEDSFEQIYCRVPSLPALGATVSIGSKDYRVRSIGPALAGETRIGVEAIPRPYTEMRYGISGVISYETAPTATTPETIPAPKKA